MTNPVDPKFPISQNFGERPDYYKQFGLNGHEGIDFAVPNGTPVFAIADGTVVRRMFSAKDYGNFVTVWHPNLKIASWYCHLQSQSVNVGDHLNEGAQIGLSNNTGNSSGPHLHFGICQVDGDGVRINTNNGYQGFVDPAPYLKSSPTPQPPMTDQIVLDKASYFDQVVHLLFTWGKVTEDNSNLYDFTAISGVLIALKQDRDFLAGKATKWDALCNTLGFTDSNTVEVIDIENKIKEQQPTPTVGTTTTPPATTTTVLADNPPQVLKKEYKSPLANLLVIIADKLG